MHETTNPSLRWRLLIELGVLTSACATGGCRFPTEPLGFTDHAAGSGVVVSAGAGGRSATATGSGGTSDGDSANAPSSMASGGSGASSGSGGSAADAGAAHDANVPLHDSGSDVIGDAAVDECTHASIDASRVVMLGDSYNDLGNVGPALQQAASAMYRPYYLAGAAIDNGSDQLSIPYQFASMAMTDNSQIEVVIMNGGMNDLIVYNGSCLSTPAPDNACAAAIDATIARTKTLIGEIADKGVKHLVYYYYPHFDRNGGGVLPSPSYMNDWIDYALEHGLPELCCGANTPAAGASDYSCHGSGNDGAIDCVFVDVRPEFVGHDDPNDAANYWFQNGLGVVPNEAGASAIVDKVRERMIEHCIAE